ncbi:DUF4397 domain-containing protein [Neobacillus notoginsengisoli]|nr:DUF4397 domain-containing protein [Neobacillus notoginsengisoli]
MATQPTAMNLFYDEGPLPRGTGRVFHCNPNLGKIDVFINGLLIIKDLSFKQVSSLAAFPPGRCQIDVYVNRKLLVSNVFTIQEEEKIFAVITGDETGVDIAKFSADHLVPPGESAACFLHLASRLGKVDWSVHKGDVVFPSAAYLSATPWLPLSPVSFHLEARKAGTKMILLPMPNCSFEANEAYLICIIHNGNQLEKLPIKLK